MKTVIGLFSLRGENILDGAKQVLVFVSGNTLQRYQHHCGSGLPARSPMYLLCVAPIDGLGQSVIITAEKWLDISRSQTFN